MLECSMAAFAQVIALLCVHNRGGGSAVSAASVATVFSMRLMEQFGC